MDKVSKVSADNERRTLSTFFTWMHNNDYIPRNPMNKVEIMKYSKPKKKAFTDMEVEQLRAACNSERETAVVEVLLSTWCRVSELCDMKIDELEGDKIIVHGKGEKDRTVFLNAKAQLALSKYLEKRSDNNPYIFPKAAWCGDITKFTAGIPKGRQNKWYEIPEMIDQTEECDKGTIESMLRKIGQRAKVKKTHPHRFRRTGATFALRAGMPIMTISKLLGHANIAVTQVYLDINDEDLEQEHCEDAISRQAVLDKKEFIELDDGQSFYSISPEDVETLPPVTLQPKTGRWILDETDNSITCDKCGCLIWANDISNGEAYYCPNCGARMVEL